MRERTAVAGLAHGLLRRGRSFGLHLSRTIRRHWIFTTLLVLGLALRVLVMLAYRPAIFYIDSVASYLLPLPRLDPTGQDPIGYDLVMLWPILKIANITTLVAVQHLLGLGIAVTGYALLVHKGVRLWLAALATAPVLLDAYQLQIEHNIMPEPLFEALLVAALTALTWPSRPGPYHVIAAGLLLGAAVPVRQVGEVVIVPLVAYPLLAGGAWRRRLALGGAALGCFALPVAGYATYFHHFSGEFGITHATGNALYGRVATFADCTNLTLPDYERPLCPPEPANERLGPEFYSNDGASPGAPVRDHPPAGMTGNQVMSDFSRRIILHQPLDFARSVLADGARVFAWQRTDGPNTGYPPVDRWHFQRGFPVFPPLVSIPQITTLSHKYGDGDPAAVAPYTTILRTYQLRGGYTPGPVLALAILLALAPLLRWRRVAPTRLPALLFLATGALVLLGGDVHVFSWRYQLPGYVLLPIAGVLGLSAVWPRRPPSEAAAAEPVGATAEVERG